MNKEEREDLLSYGDLLAENFRLKHNENILQSRIDKAIEYIENNKLYHYEYDEEELFEVIKSNKKDLLEILKGE